MTEGSLSVKRKRQQSSLRMTLIRDQIQGYLFILPAAIIIFVFGLFPIGYALYMSLHQWIINKTAFIGAANYLKLFGSWNNFALTALGVILFILGFITWNKGFRTKRMGPRVGYLVGAVMFLVGGAVFSTGWGQMAKTGDPAFLRSLVITLYYAIFSVPLQILIGMFLAYLLYQDIKGKDLFRMIYFLPYVMPSVATAVVFQIIFSKNEYSFANQLLGLLGISPLRWTYEPKTIPALLGLNVQGFLAGPSLALITIVVYGLWTFIGYNVVIFLAGLGNIPKETYEAAEIDGATKADMFWKITMPLLSPVTFYLTLISFIGTFKAFNHIFVMRTTAAKATVTTTSLLIFDKFYTDGNYGIATAMSIVLFLIILGLTFAQNQIMKEKVFYG
ncbi:MAG: sugar ABC transporter permease [Anaerolineaceae bacterium]|nr:sugar ABC transporter permease [Anaerolineaceae bacterium]